jgi:gliding motility-associated-like protein
MGISGSSFQEAIMNKLSCILLLVLFSITSDAQQIEVTRSTIASGGSSGSGSYFLDYTIGQVAYTTGLGGTSAVTQGFQQPRFKEDLLVELLIEQPGCNNDFLGTVGLASISGCGGEDFAVFLNNEEVEFPISDLEAGNYVLNILAGFNCSFETEFELVDLDGLCDLIFYNTISPNNDGFNEEWVIENIADYNDGVNSVSILNRWGAEVYFGLNYGMDAELWKGRDKEGSELAAGTYFYFVNIGDRNFTGYIELIR